MAEPILIGVNLDGVLEHDGLPLPTPAERFRMVAGAGVFDYVERTRRAARTCRRISRWSNVMRCRFA